MYGTPAGDLSKQEADLALSVPAVSVDSGSTTVFTTTATLAITFRQRKVVGCIPVHTGIIDKQHVRKRSP